MADTSDSGWHLDRKVPIALIIAIATQIITFIWWAAQASARLDNLEKQTIAAGSQFERLVKLETKMDNVSMTLGELKSLMIRRPTGQ
jgi:hypothetical protein